ncbi:MAG: MerR family DNA-binding protein [Hyphomonadaceae bacterium]|nr:MerR family DNA-binding protein [Hyphomonadaceae bacterium]
MEFGIEAIRELLTAIAGTHTCLDIRDVAAAQLEVVQARRREIDALERTLAGMAGRCSTICADGPQPECTIARDLIHA